MPGRRPWVPERRGEIGLWWGLWLFGLAGAPRAWWWTLAGPLWITALFLFITIPLLEKRSLARRPGYDDHRREVPALLPRLLRRRR